MKHQDGYFKNIKGKNIYHQCWLPDGFIRAAIVIVHGLAEHSGRYGNIVDRLVPAGYAIHAIDHIGHGKSDGARAYVDQFSELIDPLKKYVEMIREIRFGMPLFMMGQSMGGLIAATYALDHQEALTGLVLSCPAVKVSDSVPTITIKMGKILSSIWPKARILRLDEDKLSHDPAVLADRENDQLAYHGKITARIGAEMLSAMDNLQHNAGRLTLPLLIMQGGADEIVDPPGAQMLLDLAGSSDKTLKMYPGMYHEVYNEIEKDMVLADLEQWLGKRLL